jgi:hypothetical protein
MSVPYLIKKGDSRVGLGYSMSSPKVDCRVWAEDSYQEVLEILTEVRKRDIQTYIDGQMPLLPQALRKRLQDFLEDSNQLNNK